MQRTKIQVTLYFTVTLLHVVNYTIMHNYMQLTLKPWTVNKPNPNPNPIVSTSTCSNLILLST